MYIITKQMLRFSDGVKTFVTPALNTAIRVPSWVVNDDTFKCHLAAGNIQMLHDPKKYNIPTPAAPVIAPISDEEFDISDDEDPKPEEGEGEELEDIEESSEEEESEEAPPAEEAPKSRSRSRKKKDS